MNIIISQSNEQKSAHLTQWSSNSVYDINNITIYVQQGVVTPKTFQLSYIDESTGLANEKIYIANIEASATRNIGGYNAFIINPQSSFSKHAYNCIIIFNDNTELKLESTLLINDNYIEDEHKALRVIKRHIITTDNENLLVAQDSRSQQITFEIKKCYDGVSFLDNSKIVYVDFIPVGYAPTSAAEPAFFSKRIEQKEDFEENGEQWMRLKWTVPFKATKIAGSLPIALAITDNAGYVWQTVPTSLTIQRNIGLRPAIPVEPTDDITMVEEISDRLLTLEEFVANLDNVESIDEEEGTLMYVTRQNGEETRSDVSVVNLLAAGSETEEVIFGGGNAADEEV